jgi:hypothetical protein
LDYLQNPFDNACGFKINVTYEILILPGLIDSGYLVVVMKSLGDLLAGTKSRRTNVVLHVSRITLRFWNRSELDLKIKTVKTTRS